MDRIQMYGNSPSFSYYYFSGLGGFGRNKGFLGFLGGALACVPMNYHLLNMAQFAVPASKTSLWIASFALGFAGAFADLAVPTPPLTLPKRVCGVRVPPFHVDDNVVVPVAAGWACTKVYQLLQFPANLALAKYLVL
jgi:dolichol kinase